MSLETAQKLAYNDKINELHNTIDAKDKIINEQVLEIARLKEIIEKAIEYTKQFINGETSRIDEWKNVELVLETIVEILGDKENE